MSEKISSYQLTGKSLSKRELQDSLVANKKGATPWLAEVNSQSLLAALAHVDTAYQGFFKKGRGFPKFKKKYTSKQSFQCPQHVHVDFENHEISLPKIKGIKAVLHRSFEGLIKTVTITKNACGQYYASVLVETQRVPAALKPIEPEHTLGIDLGLTHFSIDSEGHKVDNPRFLKEALARLAVEQKILARRKKGSAGYDKQRRRVARLHESIKNQRQNFIHQTTNVLVKSHASLFVVEDLNIKGMLRNRKISRAITDVGWAMFLTTLAYKCERHGKTLTKIGRFEPSSKLCHDCGHKVDKLPLSIRTWDCPACYCTHDRDINAARNIRAIGLADLLGHSNCVKSSRREISVSADFRSKGVQLAEHGSQEAPSKTALAV